MLIDAATLHDLDVLTASTPRGRTLWSLVDRTRSRAGREHLRHSLTAPGHTAAGIVQRSTRTRRSPAIWTGMAASSTRSAPTTVDRYLGATWQLPSAQPALAGVGLWRPAWFKEYLRAIDDGQTRVLAALTRRGHAARSARGDRRRAVARRRGHADRGARARRTSASCARSPIAAARPRAWRSTASPATRAGRCWPPSSMRSASSTRCGAWPRRPPSAAGPIRGRRRGSPSRACYNPFLDPGQGGVANDLRLDDRTRVCVVTGPNMAGKSTFLRADRDRGAAGPRRLRRAGRLDGVPGGRHDLLQRADHRRPRRRRELLPGRGAADPRARRGPPRTPLDAGGPRRAVPRHQRPRRHRSQPRRHLTPGRASAARWCSSPRTSPKSRRRCATIRVSSSSASRPISPAIGRCSTTGFAKASRRSGSA